MHLFEANLKLLTNTSDFDIAQYIPLRVEPHCQLPLLLVHWSYRERNNHAILYKYGDVRQQMHREPSLQ